MADVHDPQTRSLNMSRIKGKNTKPELLIRKWLYAQGIRYRLHLKNLPGKPDITIPSKMIVLFVHGCFWHGHEGCKYFVLPKTRTEWWRTKIESNRTRDEKNTRLLEEAGWKVIIIWECYLKRGVLIDSEKLLRHCYSRL